ncbi:predicted protein [Nematostella vectensis]|uniref:UPF0669 protein v1g209471 n=2 Tax=Nematostella vectensis TaxID=45351 RepID=U669_NEMVE|nr:RecName: Full=UPF0669 protein v1g209471; Flags: Precursor [Nematostella vectensis]EDO39134.1 predicted protein [Nematostella vectensis]|eukprot:XP_001631197.1 predicted protein [Nematostella vectensis]
MQGRYSAPLFLLLWLFFLHGTLCEQVLQTFTGEIGAGNYTYFTLNREGEITLILESTEGDADLYISQNVAKPDYENYDLQSSTCGQDVVTIPVEFKRPIGIGVLGHANSPLSKYTMTVVVDYGTGMAEDKNRWYSASEEGGEPQEESLIWMIFVGILKIIFEILL